MSLFAVTVEVIEKVWNHPNADRLDLAKVVGMDFQAVVGRGQFKAGDLCVYIPVDSLLPEDLIERLHLQGKLAGSTQNRVKTVCLRGQISQGLVVPLNVALPPGRPRPQSSVELDLVGKDLTTYVGVVKYEPPPVPCHAGNLLPLPDGVGVYDIEGSDRFQDVLEVLMDQKVWITEKVEGQNWSLLLNGEELWVSQRNYTIQQIPGKDHDFWKWALVQKLDMKAMNLLRKNEAKRVLLRGEYCGPGSQGNIYGMKENQILLFDISVDGVYMGPQEFFETCHGLAMPTVPPIAENVILREWLGGKTVKGASNGKSLLFNGLREGIVIRPAVEARHEKIGRLILKQRSPDYLAGTDN